MRLLYVGPAPPLPGGIAQHGANLVGALRRAGADVGVVSWAAQYPQRLYPGTSLVPGGEDVTGAQWRLRWWDPISWAGAGRSGRAADAIIVPWVTPVQAPAVGTILRTAGSARRVVVAHNPLPHERRWFDEPLTRWALAPADLALVHASTLVEQIEALSPGIDTIVAPHPPNQPVEPRPQTPRPPLRLLFLGYVRPYKGLDVAIDAVERLHRDGVDVRLTVAGEFWDPVDGWRSLLAERALTDVVELRPGYVPDGAMEGLLADHHLVVAPYRSATQSGIVPLALGAGRPVVVSDVGGLSEAVTDGVDGVLVPPGDATSLADGIRRAEGLIDALPAGAGPTWDDLAVTLVERLAPAPADA